VKIGTLTFGEAEPNEEELFGPEFVLGIARALAEQSFKGIDRERKNAYTRWANRYPIFEPLHPFDAERIRFFASWGLDPNALLGIFKICGYRN
jgi:hypothetical protein